jgi:hypothetical protein
MDISTQISLEEVINNVLIWLDEDRSKYARYKAIALGCIPLFNVQHIRSVNVKECLLDHMNRIQIPDDCIKIVAIGIPVNGRMWTLTMDRKMYRGTSIQGGIEISDSDTKDKNVIEEGPFIGYGAVGARNVGYYNIDYKERSVTISTNHLTTNTITIHYLSSGISADDTTYIPLEALEPLVKCIVHNAQIYLPKVSLGQKQINEKAYSISVYQLSKVYKTKTIDEWYDSYYKTLKQTPKR